MSDPTIFEKHTDIFAGDIGMYYCGKRISTKNHVYGPEIRSHFLIVFVVKGTAILYRNNKKLQFQSNDMLVMFPGEKIFYEAQTDWTIQWIGVNGSQVEEIFRSIGVTREKPIFSPNRMEDISSIMAQLYDIKYDNSIAVKYKAQSLLYAFFATLLEGSNQKTSIDPIESALRIIKYNYNNDLNIKAIADSLFLDSAYFSRLFKRKVGMSPKKVILQIRMQKAKELLKNTNHHIKEISTTIGFSDPLYFSKLFYKIEGVTPSEYRKYQNNHPPA